MASFWHPFADMAAVSREGELVIERGEGAYVFDQSGRRYLDATAALWYCNVGHGRAALADAAARQLRTLAAYSNFGDFATAPTLELAERISAIAPVAESKVFFTSNGSDSVDTAVKLVRRYFLETGQPERSVLVVRQHAYHGMHLGGTALAGIAANASGYEALAPHAREVRWDSTEDLEEELDRLGGRAAAFFCEPVIGAGGVYPPPEGYLARARELCRERGVLFVADEVITGFARTGDWFASNRFALEPDLVLCAKGLTSGYLPMGAVLVSPEVAEPFWSGSGGVMWRHGYTYSGHATAAAVALANLDILEAEGLAERVGKLETVLFDELRTLEEHPFVSEVRGGTGLLAAIQLEGDGPDGAVGMAQRAVAALREEGVLTRALAGGALQVSPPLVIDEEDVAVLAGAVRRVLEAQA